MDCKKNKLNLVIMNIRSINVLKENNNNLDTFIGDNNVKEEQYYNINNIECLAAEVNEVKYLNDMETYDIEVDEVHEFFCNGYLTHNSALICLGDCDDIEYLNAKRWDLGNIPNWRCMSNNSVVCSDIRNLPEEFWEGYKGNGEPYGLINLELSRKIGRIRDGSKYPDPGVEGYNPCAEQSLANYETCCLSEIFLCNIDNYDELKEIATILYRICKHSLLLKCHQEETEKIVHKNMRMGIGITGYLQSSAEQKSWLSNLYEYLREYDVYYSNKIGVGTSVKLTTVKPSGTLSLLSGVCSGAHPGIYQYFIRRIRIGSANTQLINLAKKNNFHIEYQLNFDGTEDKNTKIIEFPCRYPDGTVLAKDMTAIDQLNVIKELQTNWSDNSVSVTIYYRLNELEDIKEWLRTNYTDNIKTCSFLLHNEHGFKQAPFEEITKEKYEELMKKVIPITSGNINCQSDNELTSDCVGGACPVR
jgi:ribonucleotide reductase alpha subunit